MTADVTKAKTTRKLIMPRTKPNTDSKTETEATTAGKTENTPVAIFCVEPIVPTDFFDGLFGGRFQPVHIANEYYY